MNEVLRIGWPDAIEATIDPLGARLTSLHVPGLRGRINTVLGYNDPVLQARDPFFLGVTVGRVSGRIGGAAYTLSGHRHALLANEGAHQLHGGPGGFHARQWTLQSWQQGAKPEVVLSLCSAAGDQGHPGTLDVTATFRIDADALSVQLEARSDAATPVSLTLHPYFNLSGEHGSAIDDHELTIAASAVLDLDPTLIPTGQSIPVEGTPFDLRKPRRVSAVLQADHPLLRRTQGLDQSFLLDAERGRDALLRHEGSGVTLRLTSNQPTVQCYTGQHLKRQAGESWGPRSGICLEPQGHPNAVNEPAFPSPVLAAGERYLNAMRFAFR
ncbi:MAG: hypothetical protein RLZZ200_2384 [Pseudomonadota bacterium]|jgi:aldose 1-epimerase